MKKLKVVTVIGTRPEIIRLSRLIPKLDEHTDHVLVHTGQNNDRQLNEVFFEELGLRQPDYYLNVDTSSMGSVMGDVLRRSEEVFLKEKPDAVMILGDTNSSLAAVVAERMHIPVYHMEAGNRSFDANVPEELNRKIVDHVATFNLPYNEHSRRNLLAEGIHPRFIHKSGSPIPEVYEHYKSKIERSKVLESLGLQPGNFIVVSVHRQENVDSPDRLQLVLASLSLIESELGLPLIVSTHPRTRARLSSMGAVNSSGLEFHEPFGYFDYNKLQSNAYCVISDSGSISEESAIIGFPAVTLRNSMERPEALDSGAVLMSAPGDSSILQAIRFASSRQSQDLPDGYAEKHFSESVISFLFSSVHLQKGWVGRR